MTSLHALYDDQNDVIATRNVEKFIQSLSDHPEKLNTIYQYHAHQHYVRTGHASLDQKAWNLILRTTLEQSIAHPRASVYYWFQYDTQVALHTQFLQKGKWQGVIHFKQSTAR